VMQEPILFLCINYDSDEEAKTLFKDVSRQTVFENILFAIICNGADSRLEKWVDKKGEKNTFVYRCKQNNGYFSAASEGLAHYNELHGPFSSVVVSNADIEIKDTEFFEKYLRLANKSLVVGPYISNLDGLVQNPFLEHRPSRKKLIFLLYVFRIWPLYFLYNLMAVVRAKIKVISGGATVGNSRQIYAPHGSFIIFRKSFFEMGLSIEESPFLYGEELYVAEQVRSTESGVYFAADLKVTHKEHSTTAALGLKKKASHLRRATEFILDRYF
jgi:GT2 family glycosyltransferase